MHILIDGKRAVLKKDSSFEYISENRFFTGSDSYTLNITFPLKGCPENLAIFGQTHRREVEKSPVTFTCEIVDSNFSASGIVTVTEVSDVEVKTQFLEGLSKDNYLQTLEDTYINELTLGYPSTSAASSLTPSAVMESIDNDAHWVALPWVNNSSGNIQNKMKYNSETCEYE